MADWAARAAALDARDDPADLRDRFAPLPDGVIYLDGNSLGRPPRSTLVAVDEAMAAWARDAVGMWDEWVDLPTQVGDDLGTRFLGAEPGSTVLADSVTVDLFKLATAALDARPDRSVIVTDRTNFPTDRYVLESVARRRGGSIRWVDADDVEGVTPDDVRSVLDDEVALVSLSHVDFRSGALADMAGVTDVAHRVGALTLWDLSHSVGAVPIDLPGAGADLATGCTYKYLNGGPGAPAFVWIADHLAELRSPIAGWFAQRDLFAMGTDFDPHPGAAGFVAGTPPVLSLLPVRTGIDAFGTVTVEALRRRSLSLTGLLIELADDRLAPLGFDVATPRAPERRGGHVTLAHPEAASVSVALRRAGVVGDFRRPDRLRLAPMAAYNTHAEVVEAVDRLIDVVSSGAHLSVDGGAGRVT